MIRVRTTDGKVFNMKDSARFIEVCDDAGALAAVVIQRDNGKVRIITPEDREFHSYAKSYGIKKTFLIEHQIPFKG